MEVRPSVAGLDACWGNSGLEPAVAPLCPTYLVRISLPLFVQRSR